MNACAEVVNMHFQLLYSCSFLIISSTASCTFSGTDRRSECHAGFLLSCSMYRPTSSPLCTVSQCFFSSGSKDVQILPPSLGNCNVNVPSSWMLRDWPRPDWVTNAAADGEACKCSKTIWDSGWTYWLSGGELVLPPPPSSPLLAEKERH